MNHEKRYGRFTSSEIHKLVKKGRSKADVFSAPGKTYIFNKMMEREIKRSTNQDIFSRPIAWGHLMEVYADKELPLNYERVSTDTKVHPEYDFWAGTPDYFVKKDNKVVGIAELKGYGLERHFKYAKTINEGNVEKLKANHPDEYWQIVSNACIYDVNIGVAMAFCPNSELLEKIQKDLEETNILEANDLDPWKYRWVTEEKKSNLNWIDHGPTSMLSVFEFEIPQEDKDFITERVILANETLLL
jgi:hypothetical protein